MLSCTELSSRIEGGLHGHDRGLSIVPSPDTRQIAVSGEASVTLRLGRWFLALRHSSQPFFDVGGVPEEQRIEANSSKRYFVPFGEEFTLHPGRFVLGSTLEWMSFPADLGGYVGGKSTWARRGLIIETAAGVHPGFNGCLTLELANVGEVPIKIRPGMQICQIFMHALNPSEKKSGGSLNGRRRPFLGKAKIDPTLVKLTNPDI